MTLFEYKTTLAKIENSNYKQLRALHKKLSDFPMDNFYTIHAINKTITKFKELTTSAIIKYKNYPTGTNSVHLDIALKQTTSKEEIVSLITDFAGDINLRLPSAKDAIKHIASILTTDKDCGILSKIPISLTYYSIGQITENSNISLYEKNRLLPSVICYLEDIKDTPVYNYFLNHALFITINWQSTITEREMLLTKIKAQIAMHKKYTEVLSKTYTILQEEFKKEAQP